MGGYILLKLNNQDDKMNRKFGNFNMRQSMLKIITRKIKGQENKIAKFNDIITKAIDDIETPKTPAFDFDIGLLYPVKSIDKDQISTFKILIKLK